MTYYRICECVWLVPTVDVCSGTHMRLWGVMSAHTYYVLIHSHMGFGDVAVAVIVVRSPRIWITRARLPPVFLPATPHKRVCPIPKGDSLHVTVLHVWTRVPAHPRHSCARFCEDDIYKGRTHITLWDVITHTFEYVCMSVSCNRKLDSTKDVHYIIVERPLRGSKTQFGLIDFFVRGVSCDGVV